MTAPVSEPRICLLDESGNRVPHPVPDHLYAGRYAPSHVFFLGEVYGTQTDKVFPYHRNVEGVFEEAASRWGVPISAWRAA